ncbi:cobalamin import ATP-binding protein BtuD [Halolamina pelagica]|uniref:Cobalamin import ATP-binding protein BtuD n=1 Tax=Halolamina pelagica TaxID=699431 RepID=A0A0P7HBR8_9EURY|nr:ABC transporter ATP-binding protein [Halolamina pelagica]KPN30917.1 cobalamin import ATP-binding protein BtuD [Halolamina pelagica]
MTDDTTDTAIPTPAAGPVLSIDGLSVTLGETDVLDGVSLDVDTGELVGLVGPNGAGKTTLLRTARGTLSPDSGQVWVAGDSVGDLSAKALGRRVATVPQDTAVSFAFTVREIVEMGRTPTSRGSGRWATPTTRPSNARWNGPTSTSSPSDP